MKYLYILFFFIYSYTSIGCDICGCANGFSYFGMMPQSNNSFIGIRFKSNNFTAHPGNNSLEIQQEFLGTELWMQAFPFRNTQIIGLIPYNWNTNIEKTETLKLNGLSDPSILVNYTLFNSYAKENNHKIGNIISIGLGTKFPLAKFEYDLSNKMEVDNPNFQLGTGAFDFIFNINYSLRYHDYGLNLNSTYIKSNTNKLGYQYGDRISMNLNTYKTISLKNSSISPMIGYSYENQDESMDREIPNSKTGGDVHFINVGFSNSYKKIGIMANYQIPISQNLSRGLLYSKPKFVIQLNYFLTKN
ncbi:MAG: hypothetical protein RIR51_2040 [Bacteroidota bacterium]|jgi:hypothetical protein